ncbi:MAG: hypothetical protein NZ898_07215, partial [Myxococcota bacterium]|nr:hypothetical protein [Myxococcota bacterium]
ATLVVLGALSLLAEGCAPETRSLCWDVSGLVPGTSSYRLRILRGGCGEGSPVLYDVSAPAGAVSEAMAPPRLAPGRYGFEVSAHGGDCGLLARGCTQARLPTGEGACVRVLLQEVGEPQGCGPGARCERGLCVLLDAGVDGAVPDGGGVEGMGEGTGHDGGEREEAAMDGGVPETGADGAVGDAGVDAGRFDAMATMDGGASGDAAGDSSLPRVGVVLVAAGLQHSCGLRADGSLWCWGYNGYSELGLGDMTDRTTPEQVMFP